MIHFSILTYVHIVCSECSNIVFLFNLHSEESLFGFSIAIGFSKTRLLQSTVGDFHSCLDFHFNNSYHSVSCI